MGRGDRGTVLRLRWGGNRTGEVVMMVTGVEMEMEGDMMGRRVRSKVMQESGLQPTVAPTCPVISALTSSWQCSRTLWRYPHPGHPPALLPPQTRAPRLSWP